MEMIEDKQDVPVLAVAEFDVRIKRYKNAISFKLPNRRITIAMVNDEDVLIQTTIIGKPADIPIHHELMKGKAHKVTTRYTQEGAELIMSGIAEMLGFVIAYESKKL